MRIIFLIAVAYVALLFWAPTATSTFSCTGLLSDEGGVNETPTQYFLKVDKYNPWVFWARNLGSITTENILGFADYRAASFSSIEATFDGYESKRSYFSLISHNLVLYLPDGRGFKSTCQKT